MLNRTATTSQNNSGAAGRLSDQSARGLKPTWDTLKNWRTSLRPRQAYPIEGWNLKGPSRAFENCPGSYLKRSGAPLYIHIKELIDLRLSHGADLYPLNPDYWGPQNTLP